MMPALLAAFAPARGFPPSQVIPAGIVFALLSVAVAVAAFRYRRHVAPRLEGFVRGVEERTLLAGWAGIATVITSVSLIVAAFGFYWDVAWHIDKGRDAGPFATPAHFFIIAGLLGIALAGVVAVVVGAESPSRTSVRLWRNWEVPVGSVLLLVCGVIALLGFPLDDVWHTLFGQDVTLWGPTHIQMIGGASLATLAMWALLEEGRRSRPPGARGRWRGAELGLRRGDVFLGGAFLLGLSTLQGEFDYGVPQFRQLYHPVLIMLAAGVGLVAVRIRAGRGGALGATAFFLGMRVLLMLLIGPGLGRSTLHFPLYLPEALLVELAAWWVGPSRQLTLGLVSGVLIGTVGMAAEWGWSHVWMPFPWRASLLPEAAALGLVAAVAGALLGALIGRALLPVGAPRQRTPRGVAVVAWVGAFVVIALPLRMAAHTSYSARVTLAEAGGGVHRMVTATVRLHPADAAIDANWFDVTAWQGGTGVWSGPVEGFVLDPMHEAGPGVYRTEQPFPVYGKWKALLRLHTGNSIQAVPIYLPPDPAIPAREVPAWSRFTRSFEPDKKILQREAVGGSPLLERLAYAAVAVLAAIWLASLGWGLRRLDLDGRRAEAAPGPSTVEPVLHAKSA